MFGFISTYGPEERRARLPGQQFMFGCRAFFEQGLNVFFPSGKLLHIVGKKAGENVFAHQGVDGQPQLSERRFR